MIAELLRRATALCPDTWRGRLPARHIRDLAQMAAAVDEEVAP